jgi:Pyruvate/2-oxoacid:ferredoxin oxidoreductase delta subunit
MTESVYKRLAKRLDEFPQGYPATQKGTELKILEKLFTPEEAEWALKLKNIPETVETLAERLGKPVSEMQAILDNLAAKGLIGAGLLGGQQVYLLVQFVMGFLEDATLKTMTPEIAQLIEEYMPDIMPVWGGFQPCEARVVPVNTAINAEHQVLRYEDVHRMIEEAKSFCVRKCWCRTEKAAAGHPCKHSRLEVCLTFSDEEGEFEKYPFFGRIISKEEAFKILAVAEEEGLIHMTWNVQQGQAFICNCCTCSCGLLRGLKEFNQHGLVAKSNFVSSIGQERCTACGVCVDDERCMMDAIVKEDDTYKVLAERCIGCGVCTSICPTEAIKLLRKPESKQDTPPTEYLDFCLKRAANRGIELKLE